MSSLVTATVIGLDLGTLLSLISYGLFFVFILYGQRIQLYLTINSVSRSLDKLKILKERARKETIDYLSTNGQAPVPSERVDQFLEYVSIMPEAIDPTGIMRKIEHITQTGEERIRSEILNLMNGADALRISIAQNLVEIANTLNVIHKVVRHYYLQSKKTNSYFSLIQLQMTLPQILQEADAMSQAIDSIKLAQPIGDGIGPLIAAEFMQGATKTTIAKDTLLTRTPYEGRTLYVIKAEGPMGYVGEPGIAVQRLVEEMNIPLNAIIMVDAALKLEGEGTGEVAEGVGAAIGGIGVDKYKIEEVVSKHRIPVYAILVKQSEVEAITAMRKEIADAANIARQDVRRIISDKSKEGDIVLLVGVGNTLGVAQ
jgi:hypothetical protein